MTPSAAFHTSWRRVGNGENLVLDAQKDHGLLCFHRENYYYPCPFMCDSGQSQVT